MKFTTLLSVCLTMFTSVLAQNVSQATYIYNSSMSSTQGNALVFSISVNPSSNDVFFHMTAPQSGSWAAVGFGGQMAGTLMMIAYPSSNGSGITISPRIGFGHTEPTWAQDIKVEKRWDSYLTTPNSIDNTANIMYIDGVCRNCTQWLDGSLHLQSNTQQFIFAVGPGLNMNSDALDAPLNRHVFYGHFSMDMTAATSNHSGAPAPTNGQYVAQASTPISATADKGLGSPAHAALMLFSWIILFPLGSLILRIFNKVILHAIVQSVGLLFILVSFAMGIYLSGQYNRSKNFTSGHQILGILLVIGLLVQLGLGIVGHRIFKRTNVPSKLAKVHFILGPILILLAVVNGGTGFQLAGLSFMYVRYAIVVIAVFIIFFALRVLGHMMVRRRNRQNADSRVQALEGEGYQYPQFVAPKEPQVQSVPLEAYPTHQPPQYR